MVCAHKPPGLPTQPDKTGDPSLLESVEHLVGTRVRPVHRIDRPTGGIVLFAKSREAAASLSAQFAGGDVSRTYLAIVEGAPPVAASYEDLLYFSRRNNKSYIVSDGDPRAAKAKRARLSFRTLVQGDRFALLEVTIETGRHHQIRAQLAARGHAVRGDVKYGARRALPHRIISLFATRLRFRHPMDGREVSFAVEPSGDPLWTTLATKTDSQEG